MASSLDFCERLTLNSLGFIKERKGHKDWRLLPVAFFELPKKKRSAII
jgi:hypothetical protein